MTLVSISEIWSSKNEVFTFLIKVHILKKKAKFAKHSLSIDSHWRITMPTLNNYYVSYVGLYVWNTILLILFSKYCTVFDNYMNTSYK